MKIRIISDAHAEFTDGEFDIPQHDDDADSILVIAGDLGVAKKSSTYVPFLRKAVARFRDVLYINGNHEFYHTSLLRATDQIRRGIGEELGAWPRNLHYDDQFVLYRDGIVFICATLWTDMDKGNPVCMARAQDEMNDYKIIRMGPPDSKGQSAYMWKLRPSHTVAVYERHKRFIKDMLRKHSDRPCVVATHHAPSYQSVAPEYVSANSGAYVSEFYHPYEDAAIMPVLHIHGHVHDSFDYQLGPTRVVCNPRGYFPMALNPMYDEHLSIEVHSHD